MIYQLYKESIFLMLFTLILSTPWIFTADYDHNSYASNQDVQSNIQQIEEVKSAIMNYENNWKPSLRHYIVSHYNDYLRNLNISSINKALQQSPIEDISILDYQNAILHFISLEDLDNRFNNFKDAFYEYIGKNKSSKALDNLVVAIQEYVSLGLDNNSACQILYNDINNFLKLDKLSIELLLDFNSQDT